MTTTSSAAAFQPFGAWSRRCQGSAIAVGAAAAGAATMMICCFGFGW